MTPSTLQCPSCNTGLQTRSGLQPGDEVRCPSCSTTFRIPLPDSTNAPIGPPRETDVIAAAPAAPRSGRVTGEPGVPPLSAGDRGRYSEEDEDYSRRFTHNDDDYSPGSSSPLSNEYQIDMGRWFSIAQAHFSGKFMLAALYVFIIAAIDIALGQIPYGVGGLIRLVVDPLLAAGLVYVALMQLKGREWNFGDFFAGFRPDWALSLLGNQLLVGLVSAIPMVPGAVLFGIGLFTNDETLIMAGVGLMLILLMVTIYLSIRMGTFGVQLIMDRHFGAIEAIQGSWELTRGHVGMLFLVNLLLALIIVGGVLLLCIGYLFAVPFTVLVTSAGYLLVAGTRPPLERPSAYEGAYGGYDRRDEDRGPYGSRRFDPDDRYQ